MKTIMTAFLLTLTFLLAAKSCDNKDEVKDLSGKLPEPIKIDLQTVEVAQLKSDQAFAFEFFSNVFSEEKNDENKNFMVSPFSLSMALAMTWNGSANETKSAIQNTLKLGDMSDKEVNEYFKKLKESFEKTDPSTKLAIANSIWTNKNIEILPEFVSLNKNYFNSTVEAVDFGDPTVKDRINKWADENTNGLIKDVIEGTDPQALMYLLNALYFKGIWTSEFDAENTTKMDFFNEQGSPVKVDMMHQKELFNYVSDETMQMVQLPYGNESFSMMVLLPNDNKQLTDIISNLENEDYWDNMKNRLRDNEVDLFIPKFKTEYSKKLNDILIDMGMSIAFDPQKADFSRMSARDAFISFVEQFTYINTDEVGTEAAAVTVVGVVTTSVQPSPPKATFKADRPFIYLIQENSTGAILFMGAVKNF
ncbi:MAG: serpin family protein [Dysgonamonadaceae bacterium]|jgi:serpin B|nr:serpin family protein [Dysgonamonadaceae bacterium]MDD3355781.1 serpin family protein [Dysgonamonadaceae bacterium]HUI32106.1 serpin family protein [Dysgonamonadaceae bacterium]